MLNWHRKNPGNCSVPSEKGCVTKGVRQNWNSKTAKFGECCRIRTASKTVPNSRARVLKVWQRILVVLFGARNSPGEEPEADGEAALGSEIRIGWFNKGLWSDGPVRRDSVERDYCKGKYRAGGEELGITANLLYAWRKVVCCTVALLPSCCSTPIVAPICQRRLSPSPR